MSSFYLESAGSGRIYCRVWEPEGEPRAILQIIHGIAEHLDRYDDFARFLSAQGILVAAEDHMGHGKSLQPGDVVGYFTGGWDAAVADTYALQKKMMEQYPGVPYILFGHSMGSFMARTMLIRYPQSGLAAAIISGTAWQPAPILLGGKLACRMEEKKYGEKMVSPLLTKLMFGGYNKAFSPNRTAFDWLTTDEVIVDRYVDDPLCGFDATIGLARDMMGAFGLIQKKENLAKMQKNLPVWFMAGKSDPVGNMGKGVQQTYDAFCKAGMQQVSITLYEGRHEMLNEQNRAEVYQDVLGYVNRFAL